MKKVYLVIRKYIDMYDDVYTDIIHICDSLELAVEKTNDYITDSINDALSKKHSDDFVVDTERTNISTYYNDKDLMRPCGVSYLYIKDEDFDALTEIYYIKIEEHELKED